VTDNPVTDDPVGRRLGDAALGPLLDELSHRFGEGRDPSTIVLRDLDDDGRRALADLLGADRLPGTSARISVARLLRALNLHDIGDLRQAVERQRGPLVDRRAERVAASAERAALWSWFLEEAETLPLFGGTDPGPDRWVASVRASGIIGGLAHHRQRLQSAIDVLRALPADGAPLAALAADVLGDPHALDRGRTVARLALDAIAEALRSPPAVDADAARQLWESVGVAPDPHSSTVMVLGLRPTAPHPLGAWLHACADAHEPAVLTLAQLRRWPVDPLARDATAYVVENPSLLAFAASLSWAGPPLVCSSGRPTVAVVTLLRQLRAGGAEVRQHADFDGGGIGITSWLAEKVGTTPWRMDAADYRAALATLASPATPAATAPASTSTVRALATTTPPARGLRVALPPRLPSAPWDPKLIEVMTNAGVAVYEEELRDPLLAEMQRHQSR